MVHIWSTSGFKMHICDMQSPLKIEAGRSTYYLMRLRIAGELTGRKIITARIMASASEEAGGLEHRCTTRFITLCKFSAMILAIVLVFIFQVNRPKVPDVFYTSDPSENRRNGANYTCGCSLPPSLQSPDNSIDRSITMSSWNICYDGSSLETVDILMYPNFTGVEKLEQVLYDSFGEKFNATRKVRVVAGFHNTQQGHNVAVNDPKIFDAFTKKISHLYLGSYAWEDLEVPVDFLVNGTQYGSQLLDFPTSYVAVTFSFWCNNASNCESDAVNYLFLNISWEIRGEPFDGYHAWGACTSTGHVEDGGNRIQGKCAMYPIAPVPLNFALRRFFRELLDLPGVNRITPTEDPTRGNYVSFSPNVLYMNLSQTLNGSVTLSFFEISKGSTPWLSLLRMFPSLDTECASLAEIRTCNGTSLCNVFKSRETDSYNLNVLDMEDETQCLDIQSKGYPAGYLTLDRVENVWSDFNLTSSNYSQLMCMPYTCIRTPPYLTLHQTAPVMTSAIGGDSLNNFLESKILLDSWAQNSGVCMKTYPNIIRYNSSGETVFMEAHCSHSGPSRYCWLTGRYHSLDDSPGEAWHNLNQSSARPRHLFVCYNVADQSLIPWIIITFGVLFGWLGTIDLVFTWIRRGVQFCRRKMEPEPSNHENDVVEGVVAPEGPAGDHDHEIAQEAAAEEDSESQNVTKDEVTPLAIDFTTSSSNTQQSRRYLRMLSDSRVRHVDHRTPRALGKWNSTVR